MHSWDHFQRRWNEQQSADIGQNKLDLVAMAEDARELEKFVVYLTAKSALGQRLEPEDPVLRAFLKVGHDEDPKRALLELVSKMEHRYTKRVVKCPKCGAGVRDVRGVHDERCQFCGATVPTQE
jgi:hypothetical protein